MRFVQSVTATAIVCAIPGLYQIIAPETIVEMMGPDVELPVSERVETYQQAATEMVRLLGCFNCGVAITTFSFRRLKNESDQRRVLTAYALSIFLVSLGSMSTQLGWMPLGNSLLALTCILMGLYGMRTSTEESQTTPLEPGNDDEAKSADDSVVT